MRKYMSKRQRPCDFCRSRKTACRIDHQPPCRACALSRRECTFLQDAPPRKRPEAQDAIEPDLPTSGDARSPEGADDGANGPYMDMFTNQLHDQDEAVQQMLYHDSEDIKSGLHMDLDVSSYPFLPNLSPFASQEAQATSDHNENVNTGGSPLQTIDQTEDGCPQVIGLSSDMDPFLLHRYSSDESGFFHFKQLSIQSVQSHPFPVQFLTSNRSLVAKSREDAGDAEVSDSHLRAELEAIVSPSTGKRLLSLLHTHVETQYPIFSTEAPPDPETSPVHLLAAAYAVAFPFSIYDDQLCIDLAYDTPPYADLSRIINISLRPEMHSPTISVAQTLILLLIRPLANPLVAEAPSKGSLMGSLAAVAITLGLHLDSGSWNIPMGQIVLRRRLSFVIFCLDKWMAASLGRPRQLRDDDWIVTTLEATDRRGTQLTDEEWHYLTVFSQITHILDSALSKLFSLRASEQIANDSGYALSIIQPLLDSLSHVCNDIPDIEGPLGTLQALSYHYVRLLITRAASRPAVQSVTSQHSTISMEVSELLRASASGFVEFIKSIKTDSAQVFWPPWAPTAISTLCFTLLSAVVTSKGEAEATDWLVLLQATRRELRLKASTLPVLRLGLLRIDAIFWRGLSNVLRLEPHVQAAVQATLAK